MHVVSAAHRARVAKALGHGVDRTDHVAFGFAPAFRRTQQAQLPRGQHGARPGTEVLGRDVTAGGLAQVGVYVVRGDGLALAGLVQVLEQLLPGQILAILDDAGDAPVADIHDVVDPALAAEGKAQFGASDLDVAPAQRGEAEGAVLARILVVAHADERLVEQHHHGGEDLPAREVARAQVALYALPDLRQDFAEFQHAAELRLVARLAVQGVVAVLLASAVVARGGLDMAFGIGTDPHVGPGRRNRERFDAHALGCGRDARAARRVVDPAGSGAPPGDSGDAVGDIMQPRAGGRVAMLVVARAHSGFALASKRIRRLPLAIHRGSLIGKRTQAGKTTSQRPAR